MRGASSLAALVEYLWPPVPAAVSDEIALLRYASLKAQVPLLYATVILVVAITMMVALPNAGFWLRFGLPGCIIAACAIRLVWWLRTQSAFPDATDARRRIVTMTIIASMIALAASVWTAFGWVQSVPAERSYYPMFMAIGLLSAVFCLSTIRSTAVWLLLFGQTPTMATLFIFGGRMEHTAAVLVLISSVFLIRLISQRHEQLVTLLQLQLQMQELAATDPLTGLANRRRLLDRLGLALTRGNRPALLLLDLDGFKPINDVHGHAVGDDLLCAIATRLKDSMEDDDLVCRMGGDEFAVLLDTADAGRARAAADRLLATFIEPFGLGDLRLRIGASLGFVVAARGEVDSHALIAAADTRLYAAKAQGRADPASPEWLRPTGTRG